MNNNSEVVESMLGKVDSKKDIRMASQEEACINETPPIVGPGVRMVDKSIQQASIAYLSRQLAALPNAFDHTTGKLNTENDHAVFLYETIQMMKTLNEFPIYYKMKDDE